MSPVNRDSVRRAVGSWAEERWGEIGDAFVDEVKGNASRRTGALADSVEAGDVRQSGDKVAVTVRVGEEYGIYQDEGTGIYGPRGERIVPVDSTVLVFEGYASGGGTVFARSVAGSEPTRFWTKAVEAWSEILRR